MIALPLALLLLGQFALLLDLGGRLFGTYVTTPLRAAVRIAIATAACCLLMTPLLVSLALQTGLNLGLWLSAGLGIVAIMHFLFPYRFGIRRADGDQPPEVETLVPGMRLRRETYASPLVPDAADGFECLVLSDFHCNGRGKLNRLRQAVESLQDETIDCVFLLGDLGERSSVLPDILTLLAELPERAGTYLVRGNHDFEGGRHEIVERLAREHAIHLLANNTITLPNLGITLLGLESPWNDNGQPIHEGAEFTIGLTHTPDNFPRLAQWKVPLSFAGHTHGGKLRLPRIGALLVPCWLGRFLDQGWFEKEGSRIFVTKGIGYFPGWLGSSGEILRVRLQKTAT